MWGNTRSRALKSTQPHGRIRRWTSMFAAGLMAFGGLAAIEMVTAAPASAATITVTNPQAQMATHSGWSNATGNANPVAGDCIRYGDNAGGTTGTASNTATGGSNGTSGSPNHWTNGRSGWVSGGTNTAWSAHGNSIQSCGQTGEVNLGTQSALGFQPRAISSIETGTTFNLGRMAHRNNPVYVTNSWFRGSMNIQFMGMDMSFPWRLHETPNNATPPTNVANNDLLDFLSQTTNQTFTHDGLTYTMVVHGFTAAGANNTCAATLPGGVTPVNQFSTVETQVTYGCLWASVEQVRNVTVQKVVSSPYGAAPAQSFSFTSDSTLDGSVWDQNFSLTHGQSVTRSYNSGEQIMITEAAQSAPWSFTSVACVDGTGAAVPGVTVTGRTVTIPRDTTTANPAAADITCTYTNTYTPRATLSLVKDVVSTGQPVPVAQPAHWTLSAQGQGVVSAEGVSGPGNSAEVTGQSVIAGTYLLGETASNPDTTGGYQQDGAWVCQTSGGGAVPVSNGSVTLTHGQNVTCTVTNRYQTGSLAITKTVDAADDAYTAGAAMAFTAEYVCLVPGGTNQITGTVTVNPAATNGAAGTAATVADLPAGADCTVTELNAPTGTSENLANGSYVWGSPTTTPSTSVEVPTNDTVTVNLTNPVSQNTGSLVITKQVQPRDGVPASGYTGGSRAFEIGYVCTIGAATTASGTIELAHGDSETVTGIPATSSCAITETQSAVDGDFADASYRWDGTDITSPVTILTDAAATATVINHFTRDLADLTIAKRVDGAGYTGGDFTIEYTCGDVSGSVTLAHGASDTVQVPSGVECEVAETDARPDLAPGYVWGDPAYEGLTDGTVTATSDAPASVTVVNPNTIGFGRIAVTKQIANFENQVSAGTTFEVTVVCDAPAQGQQSDYSQVFTFETELGDAQETPFLPIGTSCTVEETALPSGSTALPGASYAWVQTPTYEGLTDGAVTVPASQTPASVTVVNDIVRVYGPLAITKTVTNGTDAAITAPFTGTWTCVFGGETVANGTWSAPASGGAANLSNATGDHTQLLVGSVCEVTETAPANPVDGDNSYTWAVELPTSLAPITTAGVTAEVENTLSRTTGSFSVTKSVTGGTAGEQFEDTDFTFHFECRPASGDPISGTLGVPAGGSGGPDEEIPAGSDCVVTEDTGNLPTPIDPFRWDDVSFSVTGAEGTLVADGIRFTTPADGATVAVAVTNTMSARAGDVSVRKQVTALGDGFVGGAEPLFPMTLTCVDPTTGASAQVGATRTIADGETATWTGIPLGADCSVQEGEIADGGLKDASFAWSAPTYSHSEGVTVAETDTPVMTVTNSMHRVYGEIALEKVFDDGGHPGVVPADRVYDGTWECRYDGALVAEGTWSGTGSSAGTPATLVATTGAIDEIPLTAECSVTESTLAAPSASDASFRWLDPVYTGIASVSATPSENLLSVGNELTRETGSVVVEKTLSGETDGFTGDEDFAGFPIGIVCALDPADLGNEDAEHRRTGEATVLPGAGTATLIADVPQGWTCAVSEGVFTGGLHDDSYAWSGHTIEIDGDQATGLTIGEGAHEVTVDNEITRVTGTIEIAKHIDSAFDGVVDDDAQFAGAFTCVYAEGTDREATFSGTWTVSGTGAATLTGDTVLPLGTSCAVTETAPDDADLVDASWTWTDAVVDADPATVTAGAPASFAVTNTPERVFSSLAIAKALEGPSEGFADAGLTVSGDWTCVYGGETVAFGRWTAPAAGGAATLDPAAPQIPVTADCSVTEDTLQDGVFVDGSYAWGAHPETQSVEIEAGETASVTVTNTVVRVFGSFSITKAVERGEGVSEQVPASAIEYSGTYVCEYDGVQTEPLPWSITGEGTFLAPDDHYVDTDCWVAGEDQPAAPHPDDDSYQWVGVQIGDPVTIEAAPAVANTTVTNTVARLTGSFSVTKAFEGDSSGLVDETPEYGFEWQCVAADGDVFPAAGDGEFSIAAGGVWSPAVEIPVGSDCVVTEVGLPEVNDPSYTWETEMSIAGAEGTDDGASIAFEIPADAEASVLVTATNTLSREIGSYAIAKTADPISGSTVEPGDVITYTVTVTPGQIGFVDDVVVVDDLGQVVPFATLDEDSLIASAGSAAVSGDSLVWTIGRVSAGTPLTLTYAVTVDPGQWGVELRNSVTTTGENPPSECPDCATEHYTPAWEISKTADPDSGSAVVAGDVITYTLTAANTTEKATVSGATATDDLSGVIGFAELGALPDGLTRDGDVLTWAIPVMKPGDTASVSYAVTVREGFDGVTIRNGVEPGDGGECVEDCATVHHTPRWTLSKSSDPASGSVVLPGGEVTYTLTIVNEGEVPVAGAAAIDDLSGVLAHAELVGELPDGLELSGETLTWTPGTIAVGATVSVSYTIEVDEDARGVTLRNVVVPEGPGGECTEDCATSHPVPAWTIAKSSTPGSGSTVERGQTVTYTLTAVNVGDGTLSGALGIDDLSDVLAQATLVGALHPTLSLSGETLTWTIPDLAPGETATVSYAVTINADAEPAPITNVVVPAGAPGGECAESCTTTHNVPGILEGSDSGGPGFLGVTGADVPWAIGGAAAAALLAGILLIAFGRSRREKERQAV